MSQNPLRVVIAEDEALIRLDLKEMLEEEGYSVVAEAGDGESAVEHVTTLRPDLAILDIKMPVLDGISAAERIAAERIAPVVILTAFSQRELVERARDAGAMAYLVKPFTKADLVPAIEMAVSRFAEIRALDTEIGTLRERLEVRKLLDRAKGLLQSEHGLSRAGSLPLDPEDLDGPPPHHAQGGRSGDRGQHAAFPRKRRSRSPNPEAAVLKARTGESENPGGRWCRVRLPRPTRCLLEPPGPAVTTLATRRLAMQSERLRPGRGEFSCRLLPVHAGDRCRWPRVLVPGP